MATPPIGQRVPTGVVRPGVNRAAVQASLRQHNLALVLGEIAAAGPKPLSRAGIASATGITRATVSSLVDQLVAGGLIEELEPLVRPAAGRPPTPVVLASGRVAALGLEVNVDYLGVRVIDLTGDTLAQALVRVNSRGTSPQQTLGQLVKLADQVIDQLPSTVKLAGAGLAVPGLVAKDSVQLVVAPNLGWWNLDMAAQLTEAAVAGESQRLADLSARLLVANEANLAGLAHLRSGTLPDSSFLYLSGDVGIGAAVVIDGEALGGQHGWAGELGHVCVDPNGPVCTCGGTGCLETYAGKAALMQAAGLDPEASVLQLMEAASTPGPGGQQANTALTQAGRALGLALAVAINLLDLTEVVLGGDLGKLAPQVLPFVEQELATRTLTSLATRHINLSASALAPCPAINGAALAVLDQLMADPCGYLQGDSGLLC